MYRFALRPAWILSHLLVAGLIAAMIAAGFWQLSRLDDRRERNDVIVERSDEPAVEVAEVLGADPADVRFRPVTATGSYREDATVLVDNRSLDGRPGAWVLTPLEVEPGALVIVNRGFVPFVSGLSAEVPPAPEGEVKVSGTVETDAGRACAQAPSDLEGVQARYACVDVDRIAGDLDLGAPVVAPFTVRATSSTPTEAEPAPTPVPLPELGEGPHLSYAVQWFLFTAVAVVGYPLVLRRVARQRLPDDDAGGPRPDLLQ